MRKKLLLFTLKASFLFSSDKSTVFIGGKSLFHNEKMTQINRLLENTISEAVVKEAFKVIDPNVFKKSNDELVRAKLNPMDYFAFITIAEKVMKHCDNIIANPRNRLIVESQPDLQHAANIFKQVQLKSFKELEDKKAAYAFLKLYRFMIKSLNTPDDRPEVITPRNFNINEFIKKPGPFDCFYQSCQSESCQYCDYEKHNGHIDREHNNDPNCIPTMSMPLNLSFCDILCYLTEEANRLHFRQMEWFNKNRRD